MLGSPGKLAVRLRKAQQKILLRLIQWVAENGVGDHHPPVRDNGQRSLQLAYWLNGLRMRRSVSDL